MSTPPLSLSPSDLRFYSNLITKNIAMGGDVEKSANSAFTTGSKRHAATDEYEMQDGNAKPAAKTKTPSASTQDAVGRNGAGGSGVAGGEDENADEQMETPGASARMVDPRAADSKKSRDGAEGRDGENVYRESGSSKVRRREDEDGKEEDAAKRARVGEESRKYGIAGDSPSGVGVADDGRGGGGGGGGETQEQERQGDDERTAEERSAAEKAEKAKKAAAAKEKKEAAVKAARERFLARKNNA